MKKIYFIVSLAVLALFTSCDYNGMNFPSYDQTSKPTNVVNYTYTLTDADYITIATSIKKPLTDSISLLKTLLTAAKKYKSADSTLIQSSIDRLNTKLTTDSTYLKATYIANNKFFNSNLLAKDYIPYFLNSNYPYTNLGSTFMATYSNVDNGDTLAIAAANRYTLSDVDYLSMGTGVNQPGQYKNLSSIMSVMTYLNQFLKIKCSFAQTNDLKVVSYKYYDSNKTTKQQYRILKFDGQNWVGVNGQYLNNGIKWVFDPTLNVVMKKGLNPTDDYMMMVNYVKDHQAITTPSLLGYYNGTTLEWENYYGFHGYYGEITLKPTDRINDPDYAKLTTAADKDAYLTQRTQEGLAVYLSLKFPDAQPQVGGIDLYCYVTVTLYDGANANYKYKYQRLDNNNLKWKYIDRVKL